MTINLTNFIGSLDSWAHKTIKSSLLGSFIINLKLYFNNFSFPYLVKILDAGIIFFIALIFFSLHLPQFSSDRFGLGILILILFFLFTLRSLSSSDLKIKFNIIDFFILMFLFCILISTFSSYFFSHSLHGFLKYFLYILFYFILRVILTTYPKKILYFLWFLIFICSIFVSLYGIYQYSTGVEPLASWEDLSCESIHTRVYSTLGNPNLLAGYLLLVLPVSISMISETIKNKLLKYLFLIFPVLMILCFIFTGSRGAYIGFLLSGFIFVLTLSVYFLKVKKSKTMFWIFISLLFIGSLILFMQPMFLERLKTIFTFRDHSSNNYRVNVWLSSLEMFKDSWFLGIGPGNETFRMVYGLYMVSGFDALSAYNIFLELGVELGVIGLGLFVCILFLVFLKLHILFWENNNFIALGVFISLLAIIFHGMTDTVFFRPQVFILFWFLLATINIFDNNVEIKT